ncbi:MAG: sensor histidine kinase [Planctomycetes bacterium]|nr:sensor histidine kinase [Planctomycetota bacterium]
MSSRGNNTPPQPEDHDRGPDPARLAHELANLLDGGLRNLGMAMSSLRHAPPDEPRPANGKPDDLIQRLDAANRAMQQMATLVQRFMKRPVSVAELHRSDATLQAVIDEAVAMIAPLAACHATDVRVYVTEQAAPLPAGPVAPVLLNALRNAVEAIAALPADGSDERHRIEVSAVLTGERVELRVRDDGSGIEPIIFDEFGHIRPGVTTKPDGHGLGLSLAQDIARALHGTLTLLPRRPRGAELVLMYPLRSVQAVKG